MVVAEDIALGLLLGAALVLLAVTLLSYRRSGLRGLLFTSIGLVFHVALTAVLLVASIYSEAFSVQDPWVLPLVDALVLAVVLVAGLLGGRRLERPT